MNPKQINRKSVIFILWVIKSAISKNSNLLNSLRNSFFLACQSDTNISDLSDFLLTSSEFKEKKINTINYYDNIYDLIHFSKLQDNNELKKLKIEQIFFYARTGNTCLLELNKESAKKLFSLIFVGKYTSDKILIKPFIIKNELFSSSINSAIKDVTNKLIAELINNVRNNEFKDNFYRQKKDDDLAEESIQPDGEDNIFKQKELKVIIDNDFEQKVIERKRLKKSDKIYRLTEGKLLYKHEDFIFYAKYLNEKLIFPFNGFYLTDEGIFDKMRYDIEVNSILEPLYYENQGLFASCKYLGKTIKVPLKMVHVSKLGINKAQIEKYRNWIEEIS
ncbi:MAG: hypothetical protein HY738_18565 [Bacteroidia bacterium]|nr:hypothetical protein [Bacteroidia bacterium]